MRRLAVPAVVVAAVLVAGCQQSFTPATSVEGLRVLAVTAEPPEIAAGETTTMTVVAVDPAGRPITARWEGCLLAPGVTTSLNPRCLTSDASADFLPLGEGLAASFTMPPLNLAGLGLPDSTAGFYFPVRLEVSAADAAIAAVYRVRYSLGLTPPNRNPALTGVSLVPGAKNATLPPEQLVPLDEASPPEVGAGDKLILRGAFSADSAETYLVPDGDPREGKTRAVTEILRFFWYSTAGTISDAVTGGDKPDTELTLDTHLPPSGALIDLWVVGREERGGTAWLHRTLRLR
jgi:hypothetical protein